jgi:hypothetical protein
MTKAWDQDEKAAMLLDRLLDGKAQPLDSVIKEFEAVKIFGCVDHIHEYGASITRRPVHGTGKKWVYKNPKQIKAIDLEVRATNIFLEAIYKYPNGLPENAFNRHRSNRMLYQMLDRHLRDEGFYFVEDEGVFRYVGWELNRKDRAKMFGEDGEISWLIEDTGSELGHLDPENLWGIYKAVPEHISKDGFFRCVELSNMYRTLELKAIFPVR